jgi:hypothetical protein
MFTSEANDIRNSKIVLLLLLTDTTEKSASLQSGEFTCTNEEALWGGVDCKPLLAGHHTSQPLQSLRRGI